MSFFSRPGGIRISTVKNYHTYVPVEKTLHNIGLSSYTRNSMSFFGKTSRRGEDGEYIDDIDIARYFGDTSYGFRGIIPRDDLLETPPLYLMAFDKENKTYTTESDDEIWVTPSGNSATNLKEFQEKFDNFQKGFITDDTEKYKINYTWSKIQNSYSGCITFKVDYEVLTVPTSSVIKLYFQAAGKANSNRGIAHQSNLVVAGSPARATGGKYSEAETKNYPNGVYIPEKEGGNKNPDNTVAGELRLHYDQATGKWESGTMQTFFRLLTDIDGVPIKDLPKDIDSTDIESFYTGSLSSDFKVGSGMAVSIENGNPYMFGPNSNGCGPSPKEKVLLVNRTPRSYSRGEIVVASLINGEWIPMGFGPPKVVSKKIDLNWSQIQKYIVDAKSYFRDQSDTKTITPEQYEQHVRYKFFSSLTSSKNASDLKSSGNDLDRIAIINLLQKKPEEYELGSDGKIILNQTNVQSVPNFTPIVNLVPSTGYLQFFDADIIKTKLGGNNDKSRLTKGNIKQIQPDYPETNDIFASNVTSSWGMYFPDGYSSSNIARLKGGNANVVSIFSEEEDGDQYPIYQSTTLDFEAAAENVSDLDLSDPNFYHLPAQFALNSSGNPSLLHSRLWICWRDGNFCDKIQKYIAHPLKGDWLKYSSGNKPVYGLTPINSTLAQFTSLSLELALCSTVIPKDSAPAIQGGYNDLRLNLETLSRFNYTWTRDAFGKAWERLQMPENGYVLDSTHQAGLVKGNIGFGNSLLKISDGSIEIAPPNRNDLKPDGGPGILPETTMGKDEASNVVGVIGARATVGLSAGGTLSLRTTNHFGLNSYKVARGGGGGLDFTFLGSLGSWFTDSRGELRTDANVQWGANSSNDIKAFGTTSLWCRITDHCPNTIYDARYFTPLQFHGDDKDLSGKPINIKVPAKKGGDILNVGEILTSGENSPDIVMKENPIRRNMLLTGGGFYYIKRVIGADPSAIKIITDKGKEDEAGGYEEGDEIAFGTATFVVKSVDADKKITSVEIGVEVKREDDGTPLGLEAYGEFTSNVVKKGPITGIIKSENGKFQRVELSRLKVIEKVLHDQLQSHGNISMLTPLDNNGGGDDGGGYVKSAKTTTFELLPSPNGKYDLFFFYANDIMNYPENSTGATYIELFPFAQYVNLEISAN